MDWQKETFVGKAKLYGDRANNETMDSALFGFWMSLCLELLARGALAKIHPVLLADPREEGNIHYAFGINPKSNPRSIVAKTVFARCSIFVEGFTDQMSVHCLILADRRNRELHTGSAAFEGQESSAWLPQTYEVFETLLKHLDSDFGSFFGQEHAAVATAILKDRHKHIKAEVQSKIAEAKKEFDKLNGDEKTSRINKGRETVASWVKGSALRQICKCPACSFSGVIAGESLSRGPVMVDEGGASISREVRVLPNAFACPVCSLRLDGYQQLLEAKLGRINTQIEEQDPIEFFGIIPEDHVDIDKIIKEYYEPEYDNE